MPRSTSIPCLLAVLFTVAFCRPAAAAWPHEPNDGNVAVCTATNDQVATNAVADGAGGVFITWMDFRNGT